MCFLKDIKFVVCKIIAPLSWCYDRRTIENNLIMKAVLDICAVLSCFLGCLLETAYWRLPMQDIGGRDEDLHGVALLVLAEG